MEFYPASAVVPEEKRTDRLLLRPLRASDVELDCWNYRWKKRSIRVFAYTSR